MGTITVNDRTTIYYKDRRALRVR